MTLGGKIVERVTVTTRTGSRFTTLLTNSAKALRAGLIQTKLSIDIAWGILAIEGSTLNRNSIVFIQLRDPSNNLVEGLLLQNDTDDTV